MPGPGGGILSQGQPTAAPTPITAPGQMPYDPTQSAAQNASNMETNETENYQSFMQNMPQYQATLNNQTIDQGNQAYNTAKTGIDTNANARGLLYSGLKQGAEANAANTAANQTQTGIANNNANLQNYASAYGNQVANDASNYYAGVQNQNLNYFGNQQQQQSQQQQFASGLIGGTGTALGKFI